MRYDPHYNTVTLVKVWNSAQKFADDFLTNYGAHVRIAQEGDVKEIYFLLYAKYGNTPIANNDVHQFKYKIWTTMNNYGAEWAKKKEIQTILHALNENDIISRGKDIFNHASNPSTNPTPTEPGSLVELEYIDSQSVSNKRSSKISGYLSLWEALDSNMDKWLVEKFESCFSKFAYPNVETIYPCPDTDEEEEEEDNL